MTIVNTGEDSINRKAQQGDKDVYMSVMVETSDDRNGVVVNKSISTGEKYRVHAIDSTRGHSESSGRREVQQKSQFGNSCEK